MLNYFALFVMTVFAPTSIRQITAVSHGRIRNVVVQCAEESKTCSVYNNANSWYLQTDSDHTIQNEDWFEGCQRCLDNLTLDSKARATSCLDVESPGRVIMQKCDLNSPTQNWTYLPHTHQLRNVYRCLDVSEDLAVLKECDASKTSQRWAFNAASKHLHSSDGHRCLDSTRETGDASNVKVAVADCSDSQDELWLMEPLRSMDLYGAGSLLSDEEWANKSTCNRQPAVDGKHSVLDPDGDGFLNYSAAQIVYRQRGANWGGHACTPLELLPTDRCHARFETDRWKLRKAALLRNTKAIVKKVYYINLDWDEERRTVMDAHLDSFGVPYERFSAVDALSIKNGIYDEELNRTGVAKHIKGMYGSIASGMSHRHVYKKILEEDPHGDGIYIVLEDDARLNEDWQEHLARLLESIPDDWNAIVGAWWDNLRCTDLVNEHMANVLPPMWTHAEGGDLAWYSGAGIIVLSPRRLRPLMERLDKSPVDYADLILLSSNNTRTYAPVRRLGSSPAFGAGSDRTKADAIAAGGLVLLRFNMQTWNDVHTQWIPISWKTPANIRNVACLSAVACIFGVYTFSRRPNCRDTRSWHNAVEPVEPEEDGCLSPGRPLE